MQQKMPVIIVIISLLIIICSTLQKTKKGERGERKLHIAYYFVFVILVFNFENL